ncbi:MAG TPA: hypothetical protein VJ860_16065 [Polyangia bacterium]|jgi:hypothetical protein|nr:hypothetical protein [Polyangia bacterium]
MGRRNAFLVASALLLSGLASCKYNPTVDPNSLICHDDDGCPLGYRCVLGAGQQPGICCAPDAGGACSVSPDGASDSEDSVSPDGASDSEDSESAEVSSD